MVFGVHFAYTLVMTGSSGDPKVNAEVKKLGIHTQLLHACRLSFGSLTGPLEKLSGRTVEAGLPDRFRRAGKELIDGAKIE